MRMKITLLLAGSEEIWKELLVKVVNENKD